MFTFKYRLYPDMVQQFKLWIHSNKMNELYNYFLNQKIEAYKKDKTNITLNELQKQLPELKKNDPILKGIYAQVLQRVPVRLDEAYQLFFKFFRYGHGFPKPKDNKKFFGINYPQHGFSIKDNILHTGVYGNIEFEKHREVIGDIKSITVIYNKDKWFLCVNTDHWITKSDSSLPVVGLDLGLTNLVATSDREIIKNETHSIYFDKQIDKLKSKRDKCKKNSRRYLYLTKLIHKLNDDKINKINDLHHKVSRKLARRYSMVIIEDLEIKKMLMTNNNTKLNRRLCNSKLASLILKLKYKIRRVVEVNPRGTSKTCNKCGKMQDMPLDVREYRCSCGYREDRDINAAKNIFCLGQAILSKVCAAKATLQEVLSKE